MGKLVIQRSNDSASILHARKRVLILTDGISDAELRSSSLRSRGYEVDSVDCADAAIALTRSRSYDLIVIPLQCEKVCAEKLGRQLQRMNPNSMIACLADCKKPLPQLKSANLLWKGEPIEYFIARIDTLATTA